MGKNGLGACPEIVGTPYRRPGMSITSQVEGGLQSAGNLPLHFVSMQSKWRQIVRLSRNLVRGGQGKRDDWVWSFVEPNPKSIEDFDCARDLDDARGRARVHEPDQ